MVLKLAWRNIWRNKRRTAITVGAVAFAVFMASVLRSFQKGAWDKIVDSTVNLYYGFAQVHGAGYWEEQTLDNAIEFNDELKSLEQNIPDVKGVIPRIESFALASQANLTTGVLVIGIDPEKEDNMTGVKSRLTEGAYLEDDDEAAFVAEGVAEKLGLKLGDTLVLISQGYHGANAAAKFPIQGIFKFALPGLNKRLVYLPLKAAQNFYAAENMVTSIVLKIEDRDLVPEVMKAVNTKMDNEKYEVKDWQQMIPDLLEARKLDEGSAVIILGILYFIITFAIFGTILMMTKEREYEFGVLTAIGMRRGKLFSVIWWETVFVGFIGSMVGILVSIPINYYFYVNPIDMAVMGEEAVAAYEKFGIDPVLPFAFEFSIFFNQALIIFVVTTILALYPLWKIKYLSPVEAMRQ
jgi:ABC-type lipoprotein release transport system permease subunit